MLRAFEIDCQQKKSRSLPWKERINFVTVHYDETAGQWGTHFVQLGTAGKETAKTFPPNIRNLTYTRVYSEADAALIET